MKNQIFFVIGESGVGKTTLINALVDMDKRFFSPKLYTTRLPREDDNAEKIQSISVHSFLQRREANEFFVTMDDGVTYYGYLLKDVNVCEGILLLNGSPYIMDEMKRLGNVLLVTGDAEKGLNYRFEQANSGRHQVNSKLFRLFYGNEYFKGKVDLFFKNTFESLDVLKRQLHELILTKT